MVTALRETSKINRIKRMSYRSHIRKAICKEQDYRCYYCGSAMIDNWDTLLCHLKPVSQGGTNGKDNLVAACRDCNTSKSCEDVETFRRILAKRYDTESYLFWGEIHEKRKAATKVVVSFLRSAMMGFSEEEKRLADDTITDVLSGFYSNLWDESTPRSRRQELIVLQTVICYSQEMFGFYLFEGSDLFPVQEQITEHLGTILAAAYPLLVYQSIPECFKGYENDFTT